MSVGKRLNTADPLTEHDTITRALVGTPDPPSWQSTVEHPDPARDGRPSGPAVGYVDAARRTR